MKSNISYVLITAARDEGAYIEKTIKSVIGQTLVPKKWIIVSDGSTDRTEEIVRSYLKQNVWMELVQMPERRERHFAGKVHAINVGYEKIRKFDYDAIGIVDADVSFEEKHFEFLLEKISEDPRLGVIGTAYIDYSSKTQVYDYRFTHTDHVSGACQMFRRKCYEDVGGYIPIRGGGEDSVAAVTARMKGWTTRTFTERHYFHHRPTGSATDSRLKAWFNSGKRDYSLGGHPGWEIFRALYRMKSNPMVIGGLALFFGYLWALFTRMERPISRELIEFHRKEQLHRLGSFIKNSLQPK